MAVGQPPIKNFLHDEREIITRPWVRWFVELSDIAKRLHYGEGDPNSNVVAPPGHLYLNGLGGSGETLWAKESFTNSTGWVGK